IGFMARADQAESEHIDLEPALQREILQMDGDLGRMNHFEVLGLPRGASAAEAKEAYYAASLKFHPDRFFSEESRKLRSADRTHFQAPHRAEHRTDRPGQAPTI